MNLKLIISALVLLITLPIYTSALQVEEPISETSYGTVRVLEYTDEVVEINSVEEWTFIRSEPKTDDENVVLSYQQKSIERLNHIISSPEWPTPIPAVMTFSNPLTEEEAIQTVESLGFGIISLEYISTIGGGEIPYPIDHEKLATMEQELSEFQKESKNIEDFVLIKGYVSARVLLTTIPTDIELNKNQFSIDVGPVEFLQDYPDAIIVPGNSFFYTYNKEVASKDTEQPQVNTVDVTPARTSSADTVSITANVTDNIAVDRVVAVINGVETELTDTDGDGIFNGYGIVPPAVEGTYTVKVTAYDLAGNSAYNDSAVLVVDNTPLTVEIKSPSENALVPSTDVSIQWQGSDNVGIDHYEIRLDKEKWINKATSTSHTFSASDGYHKVYVKVVNDLGEEAVAQVGFTVDTSPPDVLKVWHEPSLPIIRDQITVYATVFDHSPVSVALQYSTDGTTWSEAPMSAASYQSLSQGEKVEKLGRGTSKEKDKGKPKKDKVKKDKKKFVVKHKKGMPQDVIEKLGGKEVGRIPKLNVKVVEARDPEKFLKGAKKHKEVIYVEEAEVLQALSSPSDQLYSEQWGLANINAENAWAYTQGNGAVVGVIDTGVEYTHPDLDDNYAGGYDFVNKDNDPLDDNGHGTHVAGIIAAEMNGDGTVGVAPEAKILAYKALDSSGTGYDYQVAEAILRAVDDGADIISMSLGGSYSNVLEEACEYAKSKGVLLIAAAGNNGGNVLYPAALDSVMAVSSTNQENELSSFSSFGPEIEVSAPGGGDESVISTYIGNGYSEKTGTSMSAAHVTGVAALSKSLHSDWSGEKIRGLLRLATMDVGPTGRDDQFGYGIIDASKIMNINNVPEGGSDTNTEPIDGADDESTILTTNTFSVTIGPFPSTVYFRIEATDSLGHPTLDDNEGANYEIPVVDSAIILTSPTNTTYNTSDVPLEYSVLEPTVWEGYSLNGEEDVITGGAVTTFSDGSSSRTLTFSPSGSSEIVYVKIPKNATVVGNPTLTLQGHNTEKEIVESHTTSFSTTSNDYVLVKEFKFPPKVDHHYAIEQVRQDIGVNYQLSNALGKITHQIGSGEEITAFEDATDSLSSSFIHDAGWGTGNNEKITVRFYLKVAPQTGAFSTLETKMIDNFNGEYSKTVTVKKKWWGQWKYMEWTDTGSNYLTGASSHDGRSKVGRFVYPNADIDFQEIWSQSYHWNFGDPNGYISMYFNNEGSSDVEVGIWLYDWAGKSAQTTFKTVSADGSWHEIKWYRSSDLIFADSGFNWNDVKKMEISAYNEYSGDRNLYFDDISWVGETTGSASFSSTPSGAQIWVDGSNTGYTTPRTISGYTPGSHSYTFKRSGYADKSGTFSITVGQTTNVQATLTALTGSASFSSTPSGAQIWVDGSNTGYTTPKTISGYSPGSHSYTYKKSEYSDYSGTFSITAGQTTNVQATLTLLTGSASFTSTPTGAQIWVDGTNTGYTTPKTITGLIPGSHTYALKLSGYADYTGSLNIVASQTTNIQATLTELTGSASFGSTPTGAQIWVDGSNTGYTTSKTISGIKTGSHDYTFKLSGYADYLGTFSIAAGQTTNVQANLQQITATMSGLEVKVLEASTYPTNIYVDIGSDSSSEVMINGELISVKDVELDAGAINEYVASHDADAEGYVTVPIKIGSDTTGIAELSYLYMNYRINTTLKNLSDGPHVVDIYAIDLDGNVDSRTVYFTISTDSTPPVTTDNAPPGWQNADFTVNLTAYDNETGVNTTYYRLDSENWIEGTSISIDDEGNHTIEYYSVDNAGNEENVTITYAALDKTAPSIDISGVTNGSYYNVDATALVNVTDLNLNTSVITLNGEPYPSGSVISEERFYLLEVNATDLAGNPASESLYFTIDKTPPTVEITAPANGSYLKAAVEVTGEATDQNLDNVTMSIDGEVVANATYFLWDTTGVPDETHYIELAAVDKADNPASTTILVTVDNAPPELSIDSPLARSYSYTENVTLNFSSRDETSGVALLDADIDGVSVESGQIIELFGFALGRHTFTVTATDNAGNNVTESVVFTVIDDIAPDTSDNADERWHTSDVPITLTSKDEKSSVKEIHYMINGGTEIVVDSDAVQFVITYEDNNNTLKYWAVDEWDNAEEPKVVVGIKLDKTRPITTDDADAEWHTSDITLALNAIDPQVQGASSGVRDTYYIIYEDERPQRINSLSADGQPLITYEDDDNWLEYWSVDVAGNEENHTLRKGIKLDKTPPVVSIGLDPAKDEYFNNEPLPIKHEAYDPVVQGTPSDAVSVIFDIDGEVVENPADVTGWVGTHTLTAMANDLAGNNASASVTFTVVLRADINIDPDTLNLYSNGNWITGYIEFPVGNYDVMDIDVNTVTIEGTNTAENNPKYDFVSDPQPVDKDGDGLAEFMVKFDRNAVGSLLSPSDAVTLSVRGEISEGIFEGSDTIRVTANGNNRTQKGASLKVDKKVKAVEIDGERDKSRAEVNIDLIATGRGSIKAVLVHEHIPEGLIIKNTDCMYVGYGLVCRVGTVEHKEIVKYTLILPEVSEPVTYELKTVVEYQTAEDLETLEKTSYLTVTPKGQVKLGEGNQSKRVKAKGKGYNKVYWALSNSKGGSDNSKGKKKGHDKDKDKGKPDKPPKDKEPGNPDKPDKEVGPPDNSNPPDNSDKPENPGKPDKPVNPDKPSKNPGNGGNPKAGKK